MNKLVRPKYNRMYEVMKVRLGKNISKCVFIILIFNLVQSFIFSFTLSPLMMAGKNGMNFITLIISALCTVFAFFLSFQLLYGINSFFTKTILARKDVMGVFTSGFRDKTKRSNFISGVFTIILILSAAAAATVIYFNRDEIISLASEYFLDENSAAEMISLVKAAGLALVFCAVFFICGILVSIPFLFSWNIVFDDKKISALKALKKSMSLMLPNYFHFIGFVIYSCIKNFVFIVLFFAINMKLSAANSGISNFFSMVVGFFAFTQEYTIIAKSYSSIPVYYYSLLSENGMVKTVSQKNENPAQ